MCPENLEKEIQEHRNKLREIQDIALKDCPDFIQEMDNRELCTLVWLCFGMFKEASRVADFGRNPYQDYAKIENPKSTHELMKFFYGTYFDYKCCASFDFAHGALGDKGNEFRDAGHVYVLLMSDGHVKIGRSINPGKRIASIVSSNQYTLSKHWVSQKVRKYEKLETSAHRYFSNDRVGGEYFAINFDEAVEWIAGEVERHPSIYEKADEMDGAA